MDYNYAIILVTFNRKAQLVEVINRIQQQTRIPSWLIIVDNHSEDGTAEYLDHLTLSFPFKVLRSSANIGHGAGLAMGMEFVLTLPDIEYVLLLEDDSFAKAELAETMLGHITRAADYSIIGIRGVRVGIGKRDRPELSYTSITPIDFVLLDGVILKTNLLRTIGLPKRDFFMMCDDLEFSKRIRKNGYKIGCVKIDLHEILHLGGGEKFSRSGLWRGYYQSRNNVHILKEYFSLSELANFIILESKRVIMCLSAPDRFYRIYLRLLGVFHGIIGKKGKTLDPKNF